MKFEVITLFPDMFKAIKEEGVIARAINKSILSINTWQLRDFSDNKHNNIDDKPYGGGAGMVMQVKPIRDCINKIKQANPNTKVIYLSPQGEKFNHKIANKLSNIDSITLLCGRYEGIDERVIEKDIDMEISIGDYIISGGELAAMVLIDAIGRQVSKVLGNKDSLNDSFTNGLLNFPQYTRPQQIDGQKVPEVLLSGNTASINHWRLQQSIKRTKQKRKDILALKDEK